MIENEDKDRVRLCQAVLQLVEQTLGKEAADTWLWAHTPSPAGPPSDKQLAEALEWTAAGPDKGLAMMTQARTRIDREMSEALAKHARSARSPVG